MAREVSHHKRAQSSLLVVPARSGVRLDAEAEQWARESFGKFAEERASGEAHTAWRNGDTRVLRDHGLRCAMASVLGHVPTEAEVASFVAGPHAQRRLQEDECDNDTDDAMDMETFVSRIKERLLLHTPEDTIRLAFGAFDVYCEGGIRRDVCRDIIKRHCKAIPDAVIDDAFDEVDVNGDGLVSWLDFESMMFARLVA